jgi:hypothetical protein
MHPRQSELSTANQPIYSPVRGPGAQWDYTQALAGHEDNLFRQAVDHHNAGRLVEATRFAGRF